MKFPGPTRQRHNRWRVFSVPIRALVQAHLFSSKPIAKSLFRRRFVAPSNQGSSDLDTMRVGVPLSAEQSARKGVHPVRDWIDQLSFRARASIIIVVFMLTMLAMMDNSAQLLAELGQAVFASAVSASWW
jgi:hypothetical protein